MYKKLNYAIGDVASTTAIDATTLTLKAGHTITTDIGETNKFVAVFYDGTKSSPYQDTNREIVEAYRTNTNDFVIARAKEGTSAKQWIENDKFMLIASAGVFNEYETEIASKEDALGYTAENVANRLAAFQGTPDDTHYPSEKLVKDSLDAKAPTASPTFTGTVILPKTTKIQDTSANHTYNLAVSELTADRAVTLPLLTGDDTFLFKDFHKATSAEINTGTEDNKYITPDQLAGSNAFTKTVQQYCVEWGTELAVEDGVGYIEIPAECNGMNLISARARVGTAGVTGNTTFDIYNVTDGTTMLSSAITIASGATSGTGTVDTAHDDVATGDIIRIDCDSISTIPPKGLIVTLSFRL